MSEYSVPISGAEAPYANVPPGLSAEVDGAHERVADHVGECDASMLGSRALQPTRR